MICLFNFFLLLLMGHKNFHIGFSLPIYIYSLELLIVNAVDNP